MRNQQLPLLPFSQAMGIRCCRDHSVTNSILHKIDSQPSSPPSPYQAIDLDRLENVILQILQKAKESSCSDHHKPFKGKWRLPESSDLAQLRSFLSDTGDCAEDLNEILSSDLSEGLNSVVGNVLETVGKVHWVTAGLLVLGLVLSRFETIRANQEECLDLLDEMFRLCRYLRDIMKTPSFKESVGDIIETAIKMIVEGATMCFAVVESSKAYKFWGAPVDKEKLQRLRKNLNKIHTHPMLKACIYRAQQVSKEPLRLRRQEFYPKYAVGIEHTVHQVIGMLGLQSGKRVVAVVVHGVHGTGKTTIGDAVYASVKSDDFRYSKVCLFESAEKTPDITNLQKQILEDICGCEYRRPSSDTEGQNLLLQILKDRACFIYIDNVVRRNELRRLLPKNLWHSQKLRLLLTACDSNVADCLSIGDAKVVKALEVPRLDYRSSMTVLAGILKGSEPSSSWDCFLGSEEIDYILEICGGVPLALETVGNFIVNEEDKSRAFQVIEQEFQRDGGKTFGLEKQWKI